MKRIISNAIHIYAVAAAYFLVLLLLLGVMLVVTGAFTWGRVKDAARALRGKVEVHPARPAGAEEEWVSLEAARRQEEERIGRKERELRKLEEMAAQRLAQMEAEKAELEKKWKLTEEAAERLKKQQAAAVAEQAGAEMEANLPIFSKMDGAAILDLTRGWEDARIIRYLRALKPSKAAEVLEAMRTDPQFEKEFRLLPPDAPKGTLTRAELIMEGLKKSP